MQILLFDATAQKRTSEGAGAWAAPWTALSISMGIPGHMRAYRCSQAYAGIWALGLATCGYEEYGHKWRKAHPILTPTVDHCHHHCAVVNSKHPTIIFTSSQISRRSLQPKV